MHEFKQSRVLGFFRFVLTEITLVLFFSLFLFLTIKSILNPNLHNFLPVLISLTSIDCLLFLVFLIRYILRFHLFFKKRGKVFPVTIFEGKGLNVFMGQAEINNVMRLVEIRYNIAGTYNTIILTTGVVCQCFVREEDLDKENIIAAMYR